jgi:glycosyltransferase involved in cell wall biosynthesis
VDGTVSRARELYPSVVVVRQTRTGKGNALACGIAASSGEVLVTLDADGSADPAEIPRFVRALVDGADYAKGTRFRSGGGSHDITRLRRLGNNGLVQLVNLLFRTGYTDLCYGYNAFWRRAVAYLGLPEVDLPEGEPSWGDGFEVETLLNIRVARQRLRVCEVASVEARRLHGVSNLNAFSDGIRVMRTILREYRAVPLRAGATRRLPDLVQAEE